MPVVDYAPRLHARHFGEHWATAKDQTWHYEHCGTLAEEGRVSGRFPRTTSHELGLLNLSLSVAFSPHHRMCF